MRVRKLDPSGDMIFGRGPTEFLVDTPEAVAQCVRTRLALSRGEWFLDLTEGMPWYSQVFGVGTQQLHDIAIRERILDTPGVTGIAAYASSVDSKRRLSAGVTIDTSFGVASGLIEAVPAPTGDRLDIDFVLDLSALA